VDPARPELWPASFELPSHILLAPPLTITRDEVDDVLIRLDAAIAETLTLVKPILPPKD